METLFKLNLKKRLIMRGYQEAIVRDIISKFTIGKPYVLGSCPSSGKTEITIEVIIRLIEAGLITRVLILAHSTNILKDNFYNRLMEYFNEEDVAIMRGQKDYNYDAMIQVMIPQNIKHIKGVFDLMVTDEAQHNVLAEDGNYSRIKERVQLKFELLLTGTPSKFVRENALSEGELPYHINTVGMDTIGFEHFHDVRFDLIRSDYGFTNADYNQTQELSSDIKFSFEQTEKTINNVIIGAVRNIALRNGVYLPKNSDFILEGRKLVKSDEFGKTLIMCRSIEQANQTAQIISKLFGVNVRVSQSQNDSDSLELERFKNGDFNFLCVVKRAREGYDDNKVLNLIDITMTHNIDLIYQMFCRVVRLDKANPNPKLYIKVTSNAEGMPEYTMNIMTAALMLGSTENLARFNGSNFRDIEMPRIQQEETDEDDIFVNGSIDIVDTYGNIIRRRNINELMALDLIKMFSDDHENLVNGNDRYAMTTLGEALLRLQPANYDVSTIEECIELGIKYDIKSSSDWWENYKEIGEKEDSKLPSQPWIYFNLEGGGNEFSRLLKTKEKTYLPAYLGEFSKMNKLWNTSNSNNNYKRFKKDNTEWKSYHKLYSKAREKWSEIPYIELSKKIKDRPEWVIGDFGCGENLLSKEIKNKVHAFDFVAIDDNVVSCDLSCIPLDNNVLDVVIFSLSLMGTNYSEYLKEAHRVLKSFGLLMIAEPRNRWSDDEGILDNDRIKILLDSTGFRMTGEVKVTERFIYIDALKY